MPVIKLIVEQWLEHAVLRLKQESLIPAELQVDIRVERTKTNSALYGDYTSTLAFKLAKHSDLSSAALAYRLLSALSQPPSSVRVESVRPGYINFFIVASVRFAAIDMVLAPGSVYEQMSLLLDRQVESGGHVRLNRETVIEYGYARIRSLLQQAKAYGLYYPEDYRLCNFDTLTSPEELVLLRDIDAYIDECQHFKKADVPSISKRLRHLAEHVHVYCNRGAVFCNEEATRAARIHLLDAVSRVLRHGMGS